MKRKMIAACVLAVAVAAAVCTTAYAVAYDEDYLSETEPGLSYRTSLVNIHFHITGGEELAGPPFVRLGDYCVRAECTNEDVQGDYYVDMYAEQMEYAVEVQFAEEDNGKYRLEEGKSVDLSHISAGTTVDGPELVLVKTVNEETDAQEPDGHEGLASAERTGMLDINSVSILTGEVTVHFADRSGEEIVYTLMPQGGSSMTLPEGEYHITEITSPAGTVFSTEDGREEFMVDRDRTTVITLKNKDTDSAMADEFNERAEEAAEVISIPAVLIAIVAVINFAAMIGAFLIFRKGGK